MRRAAGRVESTRSGTQDLEKDALHGRLLEIFDYDQERKRLTKRDGGRGHPLARAAWHAGDLGGRRADSA